LCTHGTREATGEEPFRVGYVLWKFPRFSETFVVNELYFLRQALPGLQVRFFAVKKGEAGASHPHVAELGACGFYLPSWYRPRFAFRVGRTVWRSAKVVGRIVRDLAGLVRAEPTCRTTLYAAAQATYCLLQGLNVGWVLREQRIRHVHAHFAESGGLVAFVAAALAGIPYSLTLHGHDIFFNPNPCLASFLIRHSRFALTVSEFNRRFLVSADTSLAEKVRVLHCGIDVGLFQPQAFLEGERFRILTVARLTPRKGIADLVEACRLLQGELDYEVVIVGDGPQKGELIARVERYGLADRFQFLGAQSQEEVREQLRRASVFVLPSYSEGIPVSVMEAMAMHVPVVVTRVNGVPELVRQGAGILLEPGDIQALVVALRRVATLPKREREEMGRKARAIVEQEFNVRTQSRALAELFLAETGGK